MGVSSFTTADTQESVVLNNYDHPNSERTVYMLMPNGEPNVAERSYNGHNIFGGVDAYEWLDKMNGGPGDRDRGIDLFFDDEAELKFPLKFSYNKDAVYEKIKGVSKDCEYQGLPPHPKIIQAIEKGVSYTLADQLHESFDLTDEGIIPAAKLLDSLISAYRKRYSDPEYDFLPALKEVAKEVGVTIPDSTGKALMALVEERGGFRFGEEDFSEFIEIVHVDNTPKNENVEDVPEPVANSPTLRPKR